MCLNSWACGKRLLCQKSNAAKELREIFVTELGPWVRLGSDGTLCSTEGT